MVAKDVSESKQLDGRSDAEQTEDGQIDEAAERRYRPYQVRLGNAISEADLMAVADDAYENLARADMVSFFVAAVNQRRSYFSVQVGLVTIYYLSIITIVLPCIFLLVLLRDTPYYLSAASEEWNTLRAIFFVIAGGLIGSILYNIRQLNLYFRRGAYDPRYLLKYITGPFEASVMALVVLALIRGGSTLFVNVDSVTLQELTATNMLAFFGTGALVGFSMREVVGWLHDLAKMVFKPGAEKLE